MDRLRAAGYTGQFTPLEDGIRRYVQDYLARRILRVIPVLLFPNLDPVAIQIGPFGDPLVRAGLYRRHRSGLAPDAPPGGTGAGGRDTAQVDDFVSWATLGVVLGGRLGYCLFYQPAVYLADPIISARLDRRYEFSRRHAGRVDRRLLFCRHNRIPILGFADRLSVCAPIGLGLGRVANSSMANFGVGPRRTGCPGR